jgi:hypothetical protein
MILRSVMPLGRTCDSTILRRAAVKSVIIVLKQREAYLA